MTSTISINSWASVLQTAPKWEGLLVGNGGSIALHPRFSYPSLLVAAIGAGHLPTTQPLFQTLQGGTTNFEYVLLALSHAIEVGKALQTPTAPAQRAYTEVRQALIDTIDSVHCVHSVVQPDLVRVAAFAKSFETIVTFSYDLTLYWAMLEGNNRYGTWFKDGFVNARTFDPNWQRLRTPHNATGATLVFFGHGSLILGTDMAGNETKLVTGSSPNLFSAIAAHWQYGGIAPLFISEGTSPEKLQAIRRSPYLSTVYDHVLADFGGKSVVVYGLSFDTNDEHLLMALAKAPPKEIAVSVYNPAGAGAQSFCHHVLSQTRRWLPMTTVLFFDASSSGCWNNP